MPLQFLVDRRKVRYFSLRRCRGSWKQNFLQLRVIELFRQRPSKSLRRRLRQVLAHRRRSDMHRSGDRPVRITSLVPQSQNLSYFSHR